MSKILQIIQTVLLAVFVTVMLILAMGGNDPNIGAGEVSEQLVPLANGQHVRCLFYDGGFDGGVTCDWEHLL